MKRLPIYLSGMMGAGKTTVAQALAKRLGVEAVDLDDRVARAAGSGTAGEALTKLGEPRFRELEAVEARRVIAERAPVVALGGGTVTNEAVRRELLWRGILVRLEARPPALARRVAAESARRPLLGDDAEASLGRLLDERRAAYREFHLSLSTEQHQPEAAATLILEQVETAPVLVPLGSEQYWMHLGPEVRRMARAMSEAARPVVVTDVNVERAWGREIDALFGEHAIRVVLPAGEEHKVLATVERIWDAAIGAGADRGTPVFAVGGGVVGDVAGFAAATLFRGVPLVQLPTTLLAMVDSAIGGKTGIDRPEGKNLVGAIYQPRVVLADTDFLATLPAPERVSGLAEAVKAAYLDGEEALSLVEREAERLVAGDRPVTVRVVRMAANLKAFVVGGDPTETRGHRVLLNLGHTFGHAIEVRSGYALRHGEAVSLGLVAALRVASRLGHAGTCEAERVTALLAKLGLPTDLRGRLDDEAFELVARDKKRAGNRIRFALPVAPGDVRVDELPLADLPALAR